MTKNSLNKKPKYHFNIIFMCVFLILGILLTTIGSYYKTVLTVALEGSSTDYELAQQTYADGLSMNKELVEEGIVLLKNNEEMLPMEDIKINVFGSRAVDFIYNGSGSSTGSLKGAINLKEGLEKAGFEVNESLWALTESNSKKTDTSVNEGNAVDHSIYPINELEIGLYTGDYSFDKLKEYSDIAVVCLGRSGGEGQDLPRTGYGEDGTEHYLKLGEDEENLLRELNNNGFRTVVLVNTSYAMELGFIDEEQYGVEAALWIGGPGIAGTEAIGNVLRGTVNPSGRLVDTYAYDLTTQTTFYTSDYYYYMDVEDESINLGGFSNYSEGIYVGYKWYETADAEGYWDNISNEYGNGYEGIVQYPFGYGLSYGEFNQAIKNISIEDNILKFEVEVTNISGKFDGKDVIQLYCETPYINGGIEKSKITLAAFDKSELLAAGESGTYILEVKLEDIASYSEEANDGNGAYILEEGAYKFYLSENAHSWAGIDETDSEKYYQYDIEDEVIYNGDNNRDSDGVAAENRFSNPSNDIITLSRADGFANAQEAAFSEIENISLAHNDRIYELIKTNATKAGEYQGIVGYVEVGQPLKYTMEDMTGAEYDDERWDYFISQLSIDDMKNLIGTGGWSTAAIASIEKDRTTDIDGPFGLSNFVQNELGNSENACVSYCSEVVIASTWNKELVKRFGETVGSEANATGVSGWYAPGANLHRSSFSGRNPEYYSEDSLLSGVMCASTVEGALSKGLYVYIKHFAFNDQEANRTNRENCWMTEQTAREIYLRPFEIAVKDGGATGIMASYMWFDGQWCGGSYGLMTEILRDEWGFKGMVVTDNYCAGWMNATKSIMAGTDLILSNTMREVDATVASTPEGISAMKTASKNILYTIANAAQYREVKAISGFNYWNLIYVGGQIIFYGMAILMVILIIVKKVKYKKGNSVANN